MVARVYVLMEEMVLGRRLDMTQINSRTGEMIGCAGKIVLVVENLTWDWIRMASIRY